MAAAGVTPAATAGKSADAAGGTASPPAGSAVGAGGTGGRVAAGPEEPTPIHMAGTYWRSQTDWKDGPTEPGPISEFGAAFASGDDVNYSNEGLLRLKALDMGFQSFELLDLPGLAPGGKLKATELAKLDGDGLNDVAVAVEGTGGGAHKLLVWKNAGTAPPSFVQWGNGLINSSDPSDNPLDVAAADFTGDGKADIAWFAAGRVRIIDQTGGGGWLAHETWPWGVNAQDGAVSVCDADKDGKNDVVAAYATAANMGYIYCFVNGSSWQQKSVDNDSNHPGYTGVAAADFNNDGYDDIVATGPARTAFFQTKVSGTDVVWERFVVNTPGGEKCAVGDFNKDGWMDAAVSGEGALGNSYVVLYLNNKATDSLQFTRYVISPNFIYDPGTLVAADFNNDNYCDLALCGPNTGPYAAYLCFWYNDGKTPPSNEWESEGAGVSPKDARVGDLEGDGDSDVLTCNYSGQVHWFKFGGSFAADGSVVSSVLDTGGTRTRYEEVSWDGTTMGGAIVVKARSDNNGQMNSALPWPDCPPLAGGPIHDCKSIRNGDRYFQYLVWLGRGPGTSPEFREIKFKLSGSDDAGPKTSEVAVTPDPVDEAFEVAVRAKVEDLTAGNSNVVAAEFFVDDPNGSPGKGTQMEPSDDDWNSPSENVYAVVPTAGWGSQPTHKVYVRGKDARGNWGSLVGCSFEMGELTFFPQSKCYVYPNPARGERIKLQYFVAQDADVKLDIFDIRGRRVASGEGHGTGYRGDNVITVDISALAPDVYVFRAVAVGAGGESATVTKKFAVIR